MRVLAPGAYSALPSDSDEVLQVAGLDEALGGEDRAHLRGAYGRGERLLAGGEIEDDGDAVVGVEPKQRHDQAGGVRQQHADVLAGLRHLGDAAPEDEARQRQTFVGERGPVGVLDDDLVAAVRGRSFDKAGIEGGARAGEIEGLDHRNDVFLAGWRASVCCSGWRAPRNRRSRTGHVAAGSERCAVQHKLPRKRASVFSTVNTIVAGDLGQILGEPSFTGIWELPGHTFQH